MSKQDIVIIGASGLAKEIYFIIKEINKRDGTWDFLGFVDIKNISKEVIDGYKIIGNDDYIINKYKDISIVIAQGFPETRERIYDFYKKYESFKFPNLIHPVVRGDFENIKMGESNIIAANTVLSTGIEIGNCNFVNMSALITHDVKIGNYCVINTGVNISGNVAINDNCLIGASSVIYQGVNLAKNTTIGLGSVVTMDTNENTTYFGNPAKIIINKGKG